MKIIYAILILTFPYSSLTAQTSDGQVEFTCSDPELQKGFLWAKEQALKYVNRNGDPVGDWYEASLPQRDAFCMRDVSHQLVGANVLGLKDINKNLLSKFVQSIALSRDWCGYWEIDKFNKPAPVDYRSDADFWYNLPGSFDILDACLRQYQWTGDTTFLYNSAFRNFYQRTCNDFVTRWDKNGDGIMEGATSPSILYRGIGSYDEGENGITGSDLIASQSLGYRSFATILTLAGKTAEGKIYENRSDDLFKEFQHHWWDNKSQTYYELLKKNGEYLHNDPMQLFLLRWNFVPINRIKPVLKSLQVQEEKMNVEMRSYFAREMFRYGDPADACLLLKHITSPELVRREYPEVSFAVLEAYTEGLMGVTVDASTHSITTLSRLPFKNNTAQLDKLPVYNGYITIEHKGSSKSILTNQTNQPIYWNACFFSKKTELKVNGVQQKSTIQVDDSQRSVVVTRIQVMSGSTYSVESN